MLRAACTVLLGELTWVLHLRVLAQERRRLLQVELALLQVERPDAEDKFRGRRASEGKKTMDETKKEAAGAEECRNRKRVQLLPAASPPTPFPAGSARCL